MVDVVTFRVVVESTLSTAEAWRRVLDLRAHSRVIPLTTVTGDALTADALVPGSRFVARTAVGRVGFDDAMAVDEIRQPAEGRGGLARIHKEGKAIRGSIVLRVAPSVSGSRVEWSQDIRVRGVPGAFDRAVAMVARRAYAVAIRRLLAHPLPRNTPSSREP